METFIPRSFTKMVALSCLLLALTGCGTKPEAPESPEIEKTASLTPRATPDSTPAPTPATPTPSPLLAYRGEMIEKNAGPQNTRRFYAWIEKPSRLSITVITQQADVTTDLSSRTSGTVELAGGVKQNLQVSKDEGSLHFELTEPPTFPMEATVTLELPAPIDETVELPFTLEGFSDLSLQER